MTTDEVRVWVPIGSVDRDGWQIFLGDEMAFDEEVWGSGGDECLFTVEILGGELRILGAPEDLRRWCRVIRSPGVLASRVNYE